MKKETMYLDYVNNFLTVEKFAEYYNISVNEAINIIELGRLRFEKENLINEVKQLSIEYDKKYFNVKIDSPMSFNEKQSRRLIADKYSEINKLIKEIQKLV